MEVTNQFLAWTAVVLCLGCAVVLQFTICILVTGQSMRDTFKEFPTWGWVFIILSILGNWVGMVFIISLFQPTLWQLLRT